MDARDLALEVSRAQDVLPAVRDELERWFQQEFGQTTFVWSPAQWYIIARHDGAMVGRMAIVKREIAVGGNKFAVGGVAGVATRPEWRHRGVASALLRAAAEFVSENLHCRFALLLCRPGVAPVYAQAGWERVEAETSCDQPTGRAIYPLFTMILRLASDPWPAGPIDLCGLPW
ncbi:MAG: GNAT family N-acetyltransferase [Candidatus Binataceae bacterium]